MSAKSASNRAAHELFQPYPLTERATSFGRLPSPYQVYDGSVLFIGGTANLAAVKSLLADQHLLPLETTDGNLGV